MATFPSQRGRPSNTTKASSKVQGKRQKEPSFGIVLWHVTKDSRLHFCAQVSMSSCTFAFKVAASHPRVSRWVQRRCFRSCHCSCSSPAPSNTAARMPTSRHANTRLCLWANVHGGSPKHPQVDPFRGERKPPESKFEAACRETVEESANVVEIAPQEITAAMQEAAFIEGDDGCGLYHFRVVAPAGSADWPLFKSMSDAFEHNAQGDVFPGVPETLALAWCELKSSTQQHCGVPFALQVRREICGIPRAAVSAFPVLCISAPQRLDRRRLNKKLVGGKSVDFHRPIEASVCQLVPLADGSALPPAVMQEQAAVPTLPSIGEMHRLHLREYPQDAANLRAVVERAAKAQRSRWRPQQGSGSRNWQRGGSTQLPQARGAPAQRSWRNPEHPPLALGCKAPSSASRSDSGNWRRGGGTSRAPVRHTAPHQPSSRAESQNKSTRLSAGTRRLQTATPKPATQSTPATPGTPGTPVTPAAELAPPPSSTVAAEPLQTTTGFGMPRPPGAA